MKTVWITSLAIAAAMPAAFAQTTIYKHVDESGRVTYSNKPMKGASVVDLEPLTTIPGTPGGTLQPRASAASAVAAPGAEKSEAPMLEMKLDTRIDAKAGDAAEPRGGIKPAALVVPVPKQTLAAVQPQVQRRRDEERRRILEKELAREEESLASARAAVAQEQQNPALIAAVRVMQQAQEPTASQLVEYRNNIDKASGRIRGLQATVAEHEKNIEALRKELGAMKP